MGLPVATERGPCIIRDAEPIPPAALAAAKLSEKTGPKP